MSHTHARTEAGLMGKSEEERGREWMTLNRLGIGSGGRRSGNKREAKRERGVVVGWGGGGGVWWWGGGAAVEGYLLVFSPRFNPILRLTFKSTNV